MLLITFLQLPRNLHIGSASLQSQFDIKTHLGAGGYWVERESDVEGRCPSTMDAEIGIVALCLEHHALPPEKRLQMSASFQTRKDLFQPLRSSMNCRNEAEVTRGMFM